MSDEFENEYLTPPEEAHVSEERFNLSAFTRQYTTYTKGQVGRRILTEGDPRFQLPNNSTLHTLSHFLDPQDAKELVPLTLPLLQNEDYQPFYSFVTDIPDATSSPFPVGEPVIFQQNKAHSLGLSFFRQHRSIRRLMSEVTMVRKSNVLLINDYSLLLQAKIQGTLRDWRKSDLVLRSILNKVSHDNSNRNHFLYFPISGHSYSRVQYQRTFGKITASSTGNITDPSFYIVSQLLGFVYGQTKEEAVTLPKTDLPLERLRDKEVQQGHTDIPDLLGYPNLSLFHRIPGDKLSNVNIILAHGGRVIVYNLAQLKEFAQTPNFFNRLYLHLQLLARNEIEHEISHEEDAQDHVNDILSGNSVINPQDTPDHDSTVDEQQVQDTGDDIASPQPAPVVTKGETPHVEEPEEHFVPEDTHIVAPQEKHAPIVPVVSIRDREETPVVYQNEVETYIQSLDNSRQARARALLARQNQIVFGGRTLEEHTLSSLESLVPDIAGINHETHPDPTVCKSVLPNFDKIYVEHGLDRDIAKTLTNFSKNGFFVYNIKESVTRDRMSHTKVYRVEMVHDDGSKHVTTFSIPAIDTNGNILSNGITYRMSKQMVSNPVCKVSPSRVNLSSNYNKSIVERIQTQRGSFSPYLLKIIGDLLKRKLLSVKYGKSKPDENTLPYEYTILASRYDEITIPDKKGYRFLLNYDTRFLDLSEPQETYLRKQEELYGTFCGYAPNGNLLFWDMDNNIHALTTAGVHIRSTPHFLNLVNGLYPSEVQKPVPYEYTTIKIMSQVYPVVFVLGFREGLAKIIKDYNLKYRWVPEGQRLYMEPTDLRIRFRNGSMVFNRYPLEASLIFSGLRWCNTELFTREAFDTPEVYYSILESKMISVNYLKGITSFIDLFVDPITKEVLEDYNEPTDTLALIKLCNSLLTYQSHHQASSVRHHRIRGNERMASILYNEMARRLAKYQTETGRLKQFSINPEAVYERIMGDQTCEVLETLNPAQEARTLARVSYAGLGGRTSRSFVTNDRIYSKDSVGVISENTPDSGKVGLIFSLSVNPNIVSLRGKLLPFDGKNKSGGEMLSIGANLFAGTMQNDSKRVAFLSHILQHHVPCKNSETNRLRTGTEAVLAHMVSDMFSLPAPEDGRIVGIDEEHSILHFAPNPVHLNPKKSLDLPYSLDDVVSGAKRRRKLFILTDKVLGGLHESFKVKGDKVATILAITPQSHPASLPKGIQSTYNGDVRNAKYLLEIGLSEMSISAPDTYYEYGVKYSELSGSKMRQDLTLNVKVGDKVKKGDILIFNEGFFSPASDPWDPAGEKGVNWNQGVMANVVLMEKTSNYEDASTISQHLADKLAMFPAHVRRITTTKEISVEDIVNIGDTVSSTDTLLYLRDGSVTDMSDDDIDGSSFFFDSLTRQSVSARYSGKIATIEVLYSGDTSAMSTSLKALVKKTEAKDKKKMSLVSDPSKLNIRSNKVPVGSKYQGVEFDDTTVMIEITIEETYSAGQADKLCFTTSAKNTISNVFPERAKGAISGRPIDAFFSATSLFKRMMMDSFLSGSVNLTTEDAEAKFVSILFD